MSLYLLKPRFQSLLRPAVGALHAAGITANQVTGATCAVSVALGVGLYAAGPAHAALFALIPLWMLLRMSATRLPLSSLLPRLASQRPGLGRVDGSRECTPAATS